MKLSDNLGTLLLGIYLILMAIISLFHLYNPILANIIPLIALTGGILILLGSAKLPKSLGLILLGVWLVLKGLSPFLYVRIPYFGILVDFLALVAGVLILLRR